MLSGGGVGSWVVRADALERLQAAIAPVCVIVGGGVSLEGIGELASRRSLRELHVGRLARAGESFANGVDPDVVAKLRALWLTER